MTETIEVDTLILNLLEEGVPTGPISRAFNVDQSLVKEFLNEIRARKYGSAEITELLQNLMFEAYEEARSQIRSGSPTVKARAINMILSRSMALIGRQSPEEFTRLRNQMQSLLQKVATADNESPNLYPDAAFSPIADDTIPDDTDDTET